MLHASNWNKPFLLLAFFPLIYFYYILFNWFQTQKFFFGGVFSKQERFLLEFECTSKQ